MPVFSCRNSRSKNTKQLRHRRFGNPNTYFYSTDPNTIEYDNIVSVFHSSMFKEPGGVVRVWGQGTAQNGQGSTGNVLTTSDAAGLLSGANLVREPTN